MKKWITAVLLLVITVSGHSAAYQRVPIMVLPFENKTEIKTLDRFTSWIKTELANYDNLRLIDYGKSTNINGTLLLILKPSQEFGFGRNRNTPAAQNVPDTYYIITGTITYTDYRYFIHADVINSTTEWVIAKDDVYISDIGNVRKVLVQELGRRLSLKMNFRPVEVFNEKKALIPLVTTNQTNDSNQTSTNQTNKQTTAAVQPVVPVTLPLPPLPIEQQNLYNEKKQILIVFNTNERKVLEALKNKQTGGTNEDTNKTAYKKPEDPKLKLEWREPDIRFYNSPNKNEIAFQPLISGDFRANSNAIFTSYELGYKFQVAPSFYIGINLGFGIFDVKGLDSSSNAFQFDIYEFRIIPQALYRWYFIQPFFVDLGVGIGANFGSAVYSAKNSYGTNATTTDGMNGYILQGRAGAGLEVGRLTFALYFAIEGQMINYAAMSGANSFVTMTTIGLSMGIGF